MSIEISNDVRNLLKELNDVGPSVIFGGYLRDMYLNHIPNDVDIVTNISIDIIEKMYYKEEKSKRRKSDSGYDIFSFKMNRKEKIFVEIVCVDSNIYEKSKQADYTINSMLHDGNNIIDTENGFNDLKNGIIREVDINIIKKDLIERPFLWLKTLRLVSTTGFDLSWNVFDSLKDTKDSISNISNEIITTEGHKILNGKNPFKSIDILNDIGLMSNFKCKNKFKELDFSIQSQQKLCLLAILSNKEIIDEFINIFKIPDKIVEKYERLYNFYYSEDRVPSRFRHQVMMIKKLKKELIN